MSENEKQDENLTPFEAALAGLQPRPDRLDPRWRALLVKEVTQNVKTAADPPLPPEMAPCGAASDHVFACVYCGVRGPCVPPARRWGWPAAFSAMTILAASLLVMLAAQPEGPMPKNSLAATDFQLPPRSSPPDRLCYLELRQQVLLHGVESWKLPVSAPAQPVKFREAPLFYREQLERLLKQPDFAG